MLKHIPNKNLNQKTDISWLISYFHFSFGEYYNPANVRFGALRVLNDDTIQPGSGFSDRPHENMELLTYVMQGELTYTDCLGNCRTLKAGDAQCLCTGTGITLDVHNHAKVPLRYLQIWVFPDAKNYPPQYQSHHFTAEDRVGRWMPVAADVKNGQSQAPLRIHQDVNLYASVITAENNLDFKVSPRRQAYLVLTEGQAEVNGIQMQPRDAMEIIDENFTVKTPESAHLLLLEMAKA